MWISPPDEATYWPPNPDEVTITITCHLCGRRFKATLDEGEVEANYIWLGDGTYSGVEADDWCNHCERQDQMTITQD